MPVTRSPTSSMVVTAAGLVIIVAGVKAANDIVAPVMLGLILTIVFHPLRASLERRMPGWAASTVLLVSAVLLLAGMGLSIVVALGRLAELIPTYASEFDGIVADLNDGLAAMGVGKDQTDAMAAAADPERLVGLITSILSSVLSLLSGLFLVITLLVFLAFDAARAERLADAAHVYRPHLVDGLESFVQGTRNYLGVSALFGLIVAVIDTGLLWLLGVPGAFIWGVLAFVTNFIPNIGFIIGIIPPAIIGFLEGGPGMLLAVIALYSLVNVVIQSFIQPRYVGDAVGLSTTLTFVSLVFWTFVLGPVGALLAVPMSLLARAVLVEADPEGGWRIPLISGRPDDEPTVVS